jgi:DNA primase large subunit
MTHARLVFCSLTSSLRSPAMLGWIRNLLGIRKDVIDINKAKIETLKAELEVDKLEDEASERNLITRATLDDVKRYDPHFRELEDRISRPEYGSACVIWVGLAVLFLVVLVLYLYYR